MKKLLLSIALIATLSLLCEVPAMATENVSGTEEEFWCGSNSEMQEELYSALLQRRFTEQTGISPYFFAGEKNLTPSVGEARLLVLPIAFSDSRPITDSWETDRKYYEELYFGPDNDGGIEEQSVQAYFSRQSYGRLSVTGDVLETYHVDGLTIDYTNNDTFDKMVTEALAAHDIDYDRYDADNDGFVDCLVLAVKVGTSYTSNPPDISSPSIFGGWAANVSHIETNSDRVKVRNHVLITWHDSDNHTPIHEILHCMGLSDNYKSTSASEACVIPSIHDEVMNGYGYHVNSFYKYLLGWIDPVILTDDTPPQEVKLFSIEKDEAQQEPKAVLYIPNEEELPFSEFFIAEYRNGENYEESKNEQLRASKPGITLWHCDGTLTSTGIFERWTSYLRAVCPSGIEDSLSFSNADRFVPASLPWSEYSASSVIGPDTAVNSDFYDGVKTGFYMRVMDMNDEYAILKTGSAALDGHTHSYSAEWTTNASTHWHECDCGYETNVDVHVPTTDPAVKPTCTAPGKTAGSHCSECGYVLEEQMEIPATGHTYPDTWRADITEHWRGCSACGNKKDIAPHVEDEGTITIQPTVTSRGIIIFSCEICGHRLRTEYIPKLDPHVHEYSTDWKKDESGHWHECSCGERAEETLHIPERDAGIEPTCTTTGISEGSHCSICGYVITAQKELPTKGHSYAEGWSQDDSNHWRECLECGDKKEVAAHIEDSGTVTKRPTEEETGVKTFSCAVCGHKLREESIEKLPPVHIHEYPADWMSDEINHWHECQCEERDGIAPHLWDRGQVTQTPTATEKGTKVYTCTVCGRVRTEVIPATGGGGGSGSSGGGGGFSGETTYQISIPSNLKGGTVKSDLQRAAQGETVKLTVEAADGHMLETLTVKDRKGSTLSLVRGADNVFTFTMPASKVTVEVMFAPKSPEAEKPQEPKPVETEKPAEAEKSNLPFPDVREDAWYYDAVAEVYSRGIMTGLSETQFGPQLPASRGMVITILYRMEGQPAGGGNGFADVSVDSYYADAVAWAVEKGIVMGYGDRTFRPDDPITREELATILYRYGSSTGRDMTQRAELSDYIDVGQISGYAYEPLSWARAAGLISGTDWGGLHPGGRATRAEIAAVMERI